MPYKRVGRTVYVKRDGWKKRLTAKTVDRAKAAMRLLYGIEAGWRPTGKRRAVRGRGPHSPTQWSQAEIGVQNLIKS